MPSAVAPLLLSSLLGASPDGPVLLEYSGNLIAQPRNEEEVAVKRFALKCLVTPTETGSSLFFVVDEQGGGGWAWPERYGRIDVRNGRVDGVRPSLLHTFNGTKYPIDLVVPAFPFAKDVEQGAEWIDGKHSYVVAGAARIGGRDTDRVDVSTNFGLSHSIWLQDAWQVVKVDRKLFLGRGDRFRLVMELESADAVEAEDAQRFTALTTRLVELQEALSRDERETKPEIGEKTLAAIAGSVTEIAGDADGTWLAGLVKAIVRDTDAQSKRSSDVRELAAKFVGESAPEFELRGLDGRPITLDREKPILLHFWGYRGDNLEEPYGQVGYLSFLQGKREKLGLQVVGVAVDKGLGEAVQVAAVKRSIRKLRDFMRISYPIALDDGKTLALFGDPRRLGSKLPLWVLIDHDGEIRGYHSGLYEADPRKGLVELDAEVVKSLRKKYGRD